jgi:hypothetical protein
MPRFVEFQTNFSTGELDPLLRSRVDLAAYNNALAKATNVLIQPQGGLRRRPGTKHILELPNTSTESAGNGVRLVPFQFSVDDSYMLCFTHQRMHIIKDVSDSGQHQWLWQQLPDHDHHQRHGRRHVLDAVC